MSRSLPHETISLVAILSAEGASAVRGNPRFAGGLALAAQRNYRQERNVTL